MTGRRHRVILWGVLSISMGVRAGGTESIAIRSENLFTLRGSEVERGAILVEDGKIKAVGQEVAIPRGVRVIDAADKYVIPGLIDALSRLYVMGGELTGSGAVAPELNILDALDPFVKEYPEVLAQGVTAVYVAPGRDNVLGGLGAVLKLNGHHALKNIHADNFPFSLRNMHPLPFFWKPF